MTNLPPGIAEARDLLGRVVPAKGSKERIYWRVMSTLQHRRSPRPRVAIVAAGVLISATAMGLGLQFVTQLKQPQLPARAATPSEQPQPKVPRSQPAPAMAQPALPVEPATTNSAPESNLDSARRAPAAPAVAAPSATSDQARLGSVASLPDVAESSPPPVNAVAPSELSRQVADYRAAVARLHDNPQAALEQLVAYRGRWPRSALLHEVDLRIVEALVALGRHEQAMAAARQFLRLYPESAHVPEMRRIAGSNPAASNP